MNSIAVVKCVDGYITIFLSMMMEISVCDEIEVFERNTFIFDGIRTRGIFDQYV